MVFNHSIKDGLDKDMGMNDKVSIKVLSIRQPWAWLVAHGYKDIENRTWRSKYKGVLYIHASTTFDEEGYRFLKTFSHTPIDLPEPHKYYFGGLVGRVKMVDCITESKSPWFFGIYGFVFPKAQVIDFYKMKGKTGIFTQVIPKYRLTEITEGVK